MIGSVIQSTWYIQTFSLKLKYLSQLAPFQESIEDTVIVGVKCNMVTVLYRLVVLQFNLVNVIVHTAYTLTKYYL